MNGTSTPKNSTVNSIKLYFFPTLVTILAMLIWRDVSELRSDVKSLLAQSNVDKTEIQHLKNDVQILNNKVFHTPIVSTEALSSENASSTTTIILFDKFFKHEEEFDVKKYISQNNENTNV